MAEIADTLLIGLSDTALPFLLDEKPAIFAQETQSIYELDKSAAAIVAALHRAQPFGSFYERMARSLDGGTEPLDALLCEWASTGLLDVYEQPDLSAIPARQGLLPYDDKVMALELFDLDATWFDAWSHLFCDRTAFAQAPSLAAKAYQWRNLGIIKITGWPVRIVRRELLAASFRFHVVEAVLASSNRIAVHCASLIAGDGLLLLLGGPGAGKSTLSLFANEAGFTVAGDDIALLDVENRTVDALPLPMTVKEGSWEMFPNALWRSDCLDPVIRQDGVSARYRSLPGTASVSPRSVKAIIAIERIEQGPASIGTGAKIDFLRKLCSDSRSNSGRASVPDIDAMQAMVCDAQTLHLTYSEAREAAELLAKRFGT